ISELLQRIQATGLLRRYAPRNDGPKNRTVQRKILSQGCFFIFSLLSCRSFQNFYVIYSHVDNFVHILIFFFPNPLADG
ncbi:hypothetical protein, partial [Legionella pneumophila]|uniref:hypothetical protein n=1 Tax=Legionella pneumophila TaxID=446 RepID=UPI000A4CF7F1